MLVISSGISKTRILLRCLGAAVGIVTGFAGTEFAIGALEEPAGLADVGTPEREERLARIRSNFDLFIVIGADRDWKKTGQGGGLLTRIHAAKLAHELNAFRRGLAENLAAHFAQFAPAKKAMPPSSMDGDISVYLSDRATFAADNTQQKSYRDQLCEIVERAKKPAASEDRRLAIFMLRMADLALLYGDMDWAVGYYQWVLQTQETWTEGRQHYLEFLMEYAVPHARLHGDAYGWLAASLQAVRQVSFLRKQEPENPRWARLESKVEVELEDSWYTLRDLVPTARTFSLTNWRNQLQLALQAAAESDSKKHPEIVGEHFLACAIMANQWWDMAVRAVLAADWLDGGAVLASAYAYMAIPYQGLAETLLLQGKRCHSYWMYEEGAANASLAMSRHPKAEEISKVFITCTSELGNIQLKWNNDRRAQSLIREALTFTSGHMEAYGKSDEMLLKQLDDYDRLGKCAGMRDNVAEAKAMYQECLSIVRLLVSRDAEKPFYKALLAKTLDRLSEITFTAGDIGEACRLQEELLQRYIAVSISSPDRPIILKGIVTCHLKLGAMHEKQNNRHAAKQHFQAALIGIADMQNRNGPMNPEDMEQFRLLQDKVAKL